MTMNQKKALYAFGCPNREATRSTVSVRWQNLPLIRL